MILPILYQYYNTTTATATATAAAATTTTTNTTTRLSSCVWSARSQAVSRRHPPSPAPAFWRLETSFGLVADLEGAEPAPPLGDRQTPPQWVSEWVSKSIYTQRTISKKS